MVGRPRELKLHVVRDMIKFPEQVQLSDNYFGGVFIHLELRELSNDVFSNMLGKFTMKLKTSISWSSIKLAHC